MKLDLRLLRYHHGCAKENLGTVRACRECPFALERRRQRHRTVVRVGYTAHGLVGTMLQTAGRTQNNGTPVSAYLLPALNEAVQKLSGPCNRDPSTLVCVVSKDDRLWQRTRRTASAHSPRDSVTRGGSEGHERRARTR